MYYVLCTMYQCMIVQVWLDHDEPWVLSAHWNVAASGSAARGRRGLKIQASKGYLLDLNPTNGGLLLAYWWFVGGLLVLYWWFIGRFIWSLWDVNENIRIDIAKLSKNIIFRFDWDWGVPNGNLNGEHDDNPCILRQHPLFRQT